jgi:hypothetical protein
MARVCAHCGALLPLHRLKKLHCSTKCARESQYIRNKDEYSVTSSGYGTGWREGLLQKDGLPMMRVDSEILAKAELYTDCASDSEIGITGAFYEDMEDLSMLLRSEYALAESRYEKRAKAKYSGKSYWDVKVTKNYHRRRVGLENLPSIRYSNFELRSIRHQQEKRGEIPKHRIVTEKQIETPAFATISPAKTKSGKLFSEVLDAVQRKKAAC